LISSITINFCDSLKTFWIVLLNIFINNNKYDNQELEKVYNPIVLSWTRWKNF